MDVEASGELVTGGLVASAVEPGRGESAAADAHGACRNCGASLTGPYCHQCGQPGHVHRTLGAWWHDFQHSVLHLDGKAFLTLGMLAWKPGELTRRYARGERAKFVSPLAFFLFSVFLMFAVFSLAGPGLDGIGMSRSLDEGIRQEQGRLEKLERQLAESGPGERAALAARVAETRADLARLQSLKDKGVTTATFATGEPEGDAVFEAAYKKAKQNPDLLIYKLQANAYKFSWALIPISVPFVWVLFLHRRTYRREFTAYDHLVFTTYSITFMSLAAIAFVLLGALGAGGDLLGLAFLIIPPLHMYRQLRGAYALSRLSALWRTLVLLVFAAIAIGLFATLLLVFGVAG